ncbi:DUF2567 domain-containing protein [Catellatospora sichuanensis]|uniref:DUF2567 domain-containing protein n=1 Tax=Catellatospora sichuanensis TaxID=1969805 RepID=UPI001642CB3E|nr:DUF2567 domain-containing protein [Catellatospora sichuanensis]
MFSDDTSQDQGPIEPGRPASSPRGGLGADVLWALGLAAVIGVLGLGLGLLWHAVAPTLPLRIVEEGAVYTSAEPEELAAAEGWFVLLGLGFGMLCAIAAWVLLPARRGPIQLAGLLLGTLIAGWAAWWLGHNIGLAAFVDQKDHAPVDTILQRPVDLRAVKKLTFFPYAIGGVLLIPALGAVVTYALAAAWSRWPSLRRHEDEQEWADHDDDQFIAGAGPS